MQPFSILVNRDRPGGRSTFSWYLFVPGSDRLRGEIEQAQKRRKECLEYLFGLRWLRDSVPHEFPHQNTVAITVADFRVSVENGQLLETGITV